MNIYSTRGFTLLEMSLVLVVMGLVLVGLTRPLLHSREQLLIKREALQVSQAHEALLGFAARYGRLPCPATELSGGEEAATVDGCQRYTGYLPTVDLGLNGPLDSQGRLLNPWHQPLRYALSAADADTDGVADFAVAGAMRRAGLSQLNGDLAVFHWQGAGCDDLQLRASHVVAVLHSPGRLAYNSRAEVLNRDAGTDYASGAFSRSQACGYDDRVAWLSDSSLFTVMLRARLLP